MNKMRVLLIANAHNLPSKESLSKATQYIVAPSWIHPVIETTGNILSLWQYNACCNLIFCANLKKYFYFRQNFQTRLSSLILYIAIALTLDLFVSSCYIIYSNDTTNFWRADYGHTQCQTDAQDEIHLWYLAAGDLLCPGIVGVWRAVEFTWKSDFLLWGSDQTE